MKKSLFATLLFLSILINTYAQQKVGSVFQLNKLTLQDTLLNGWVFHPGDDRQWANAGFNDSNWQRIDPAQDVLDFGRLTKSGTGWIRLHIKLDSTLAAQSLAAWVEQYTASEIYVNGQLVKKYGTIAPEPANTHAASVRELFILKLQPATVNVIAVRLGYQSGIPYLSPNFIALPAFCMRVNKYNTALANYVDYKNSGQYQFILLAIIMGVFLIIAAEHFINFSLARHKKVFLYYACFCSLFAVYLLIWAISTPENMTTYMWGLFLSSALLIIIYLLLSLTVYSLFGYNNRLAFKLLILIGLCSLVAERWSEITALIMCSNVFMILCLAEGARVSIWAVKQKKKDATLILTGLILCLVFNIISFFLEQNNTIAIITYGLSFLSFPVGMSFYLGFQTAQTNKKLQITLDEVRTLSIENITKEQEKQQILISQNDVLETQVNARTAALTQSLEELKQTQTQLIQVEKMASLGELTAGIAHEIQNPLNFVNNFSEVNTELIDEMRQEIENGDYDEAKAIAADIRENQLKISSHGKRADAIVKGMLEHSRSSTGQKQLTDINVLADEFLKLSYHGLRAKDKSFNAELVTNFDKSLPQVNVVQQDIGRVLLNLFNNAFYAVSQKQKTAGAGYKPQITVDTSTDKNNLLVTVTDNGNGVPDAIKDKIMQPFFTTKPTGQGTGLGLSLSFDIIVKGHGGSLTVKSEEGLYTQLTIAIPV